MGVVGPIKQQRRQGFCATQVLQAARHKGLCQSLFLGGRVIGTFVQHGGKLLPCLKGQTSIGALVGAVEPKAQTCWRWVGSENGGLVRACGVFKSLRRFRKLRNTAHWRGAAYGGGLVCRYVCKGGAYDVSVVKGNGRVAQKIGGHGGGGIVFAAKASLKHRQFHTFAGKTQQGEHGEKFKIGQLWRNSHNLIGWLHPAFRRPRGAPRLLRPANADTFCGAYKVRRGVQPHPATMRKRKRCQKSRR